MLTTVEISKSSLLNNVALFRKRIGKRLFMAVVKSNAYGHGMELVAKIIEPKIDWFGVANGDEALLLRKIKINKPILVLSYFDSIQTEELIKNNISLVVYDWEQAKQVSGIAGKLKKTARLHLKVDTGTGRLGLLKNDFLNFVKQVQDLPLVKIEGILSHFASSEEDLKYTKLQLKMFEEIYSKIPGSFIKHIACTASSLNIKESQQDLVRVGIGLYGLWPSVTTHKLNRGIRLEPVLTWKTKIIQVKTLPKESFVGYDRTYKTRKQTQIAILPIGYNEGFDRGLSNKGEVLIRGTRCPVIGRVSMNLTIVDASSLKNLKTGEEVVLLGKLEKQQITVEEIAEKLGTINYEFVTRVNPLIPRILVR